MARTKSTASLHGRIREAERKVTEAKAKEVIRLIRL